MASAIIVLVGAELLAGRRRDANGAWLAERFRAQGVDLLAMHTVQDDPGAIAQVVRQGAALADVVVLSGGLGPTQDDCTRAGLAAAADAPLEHDGPAWQAVVDCLAARGRVPSVGERAQALVPQGGGWLPNEVGVAPGLHVTLASAEVFAFPGVPEEWRAMCEQHLLGTEALAVAEADQAEEASVWVIGVPEGDIEARLENVEALQAVEIASYPHQGEVELRFRARGAHAARAVAAAAAGARGPLGAHAFDPPAGGRIQHVVVDRLVAKGLRVATAESITGGLIARLLTSVPGASEVFPAGWITYATEQKTARLGVPAELIAQEGVVSEAVACAMAEGARKRAGTDFALATTGTAGPGPLRQPGHDPVPPGRVFIALAREGQPPACLQLTLPLGRRLVQRHAAVRALDLLRRALAE